MASFSKHINSVVGKQWTINSVRYSIVRIKDDFQISNQARGHQLMNVQKMLFFTVDMKVVRAGLFENLAYVCAR